MDKSFAPKDCVFSKSFLSLSSASWRPPQLGSLGAILSHWSLQPHIPALISLPTGAGKSGVALAAPYLGEAKRVLVVVPSVELRNQIAEQFESLELLKRIQAIDPRASLPKVKRVQGIVKDWKELDQYDVVVGHPNSISPHHYKEKLQGLPPTDLFDLLIFDEAHHSTAATWSSILEHFSPSKALLLTATPVRHDKQRLPGERAYYYPLSLALTNGIYKPIEPMLLSPPNPLSKVACDDLIAEEVAKLLVTPQHLTSGCLIRCSSIKRATELKSIYKEKGVDAKILESKMPAETQKQIITDLKSGSSRIVIIVDMLIEGFDSPNLRLLAYHDKHRSLPITIQLLGRLARAHEGFPQPSRLVTVRDADVFPELQGALRELYESEDKDWAKVVPGILDGVIEENRAEELFNGKLNEFASGDERVSSSLLFPRCSLVINEILEPAWQPDFTNLFKPGDELPKSRNVVIWTATTNDQTSLIVITRRPVRPKWYAGAALDSVDYLLNIISVVRAKEINQPTLLIFNAQDNSIAAVALDAWKDRRIRQADPRRLSDMFDSNNRHSLCGLGLRVLGAVDGIAGYKSHHGRDFERGVRPTDSDHHALGHVMATISRPGSSPTNGGMAANKGKYWEFRSTTLRQYEQLVETIAGFYWYPVVAPSGPLLPQVSRAQRLTEWPKIPLVMVEYDHFILGGEYTVQVEGESVPLDRLEIIASFEGELAAISLQTPTGETIWTGRQDLNGTIETIGEELPVYRGLAGDWQLSELLTLRPLVYHFQDRSQVVGAVFYGPQTGSRFSFDILHPFDWASANTNLRIEAPQKKIGELDDRSIQGTLLTHLKSLKPRGRRRWIVYNHGTYEFADFLVIEIDDQKQIHLTLWHAKKPGGTEASVRVTDFEEVVSQAVKSRRWFTDSAFWSLLGKRLSGDESPKAIVMEGKQSALEILCGLRRPKSALNLSVRKRQVVGHLAICQPGLSIEGLKAQLTAPEVPLLAKQVQELLAFYASGLGPLGHSTIVLASNGS